MNRKDRHFLATKIRDLRKVATGMVLHDIEVDQASKWIRILAYYTETLVGPHTEVQALTRPGWWEEECNALSEFLIKVEGKTEAKG